MNLHTHRTAAAPLPPNVPDFRCCSIKALLYVFTCIPCLSLRAQIDEASRAEIAQRRLLSHPKDWSAWETLVRTQLSLEDLERAQKTVERWHSQPGIPEDTAIRLAVLEGFLARKQGQPEKALLLWQRALPRGPLKAEALLQIAEVEAERKNWTQAVAAISEFILLRPRSTGPLVARAEWRLQLRQWQAAVDDIESANRLNPTDSAVQKIFPLLESQSTWLPELQALDRAVDSASSAPLKSEALMRRSVFFLHKSWNRLALEDAQQALTLNPQSMRAVFWKGLCAHLCDAPQQAAPVMLPADTYGEWILHAEQMHRLDRVDSLGDPEAQARVFLELKQPLMALNILQNVKGTVAEAEALRDLGETMRARRAAAHAVETHPNSPQALLLWAELEWKNGNLAEAQTHVERIIKMPESPLHERALLLQKKITSSWGRK
jgi:tetratricopeptide (TPR) repeat protein